MLSRSHSYSRALCSRPRLIAVSRRRYLSSRCSQNLFSSWKHRGFINDHTNGLEEFLDPSQHSFKPVSVYAGFDPTADSLHVGNLAIMMALYHARLCGHRVIGLVGGATAQIGDPSGKRADRPQLPVETVHRNTQRIANSFNALLRADADDGVTIVNNAEWTKDLGALEFFGSVGRHIRVGSMLNRESVKQRLIGDGLSFCEFSYLCLQANDYLHLNRTEQCFLQIGGSDQWGNILSGVDLIRKMDGKVSHGMTVPLLTTSSGEKLGKTAGNAVWLDEQKTSNGDFYQYFYNTADEDARRLLKVFTLLPLDRIENVMESHERSPHERLAQKTLAQEVTRFVRGEAGLQEAQSSAEIFSIADADKDGLKEFLERDPSDLAGVPVHHVGTAPSATRDVERVPIPQVLKRAGLVPSLQAAKRLISAGGVYVNNKRVERSACENEKHGPYIAEKDLISLRCLVRIGKHKHAVLQFEP